MQWVAGAADHVRKERQAASADNPFSAVEKNAAAMIHSTLEAWGKARDVMTEQLFHMTYGSPLLHAMLGLDSTDDSSTRKPERQALREQTQAKRKAQLETEFDKRGAAEAALRSLAYIRTAEKSFDERGFAVLMQLHDAQPPGRPRTMEELKEILRNQFLLLRLDEERAVASIAKILPKDQDERARTLRAVQRVLAATGVASTEGKRRQAEIEKMFGGKVGKKEDQIVPA
jgi:hypothetical protein